MPKLDLEAIEQVNRTGYPPPHDAAVAGRWYRRLAPPSGLTDFAVSHVVLKPGAWSSQRHWHDEEDEFLVMLEGEAVLVEDDGTTIMRPGDCASWPKGTGVGHHLRNDSDQNCAFVVIGGGGGGGGGYSDIDMLFTPDGRYTRKDGTAFETAPRRLA
ncbi:MULTISPECIES: cupin domain-containing protein [Sphingomonas]|uniref:cupin domain-containing protein n=1 Tax=Sphingomonas TaxID=13687 RepID=UPI000DEF889B|nr:MULTISPECIES: cupin domain-containing protein [Sphingomonas]